MHCEPLPDSVPMDTGSIISQVIIDRDLNSITPASLQPWAWVRIVKQFIVSEIDSICVDPAIVDIESILADHSLRPYGLIVRVYVKCCSGVIAKPAGAVFRCRAGTKANHAGIIAGKIVTSATRRSEDRSRGPIRS